MNTTPRTLAASIVLASMVIAGCSSSSKSSSSSPATTATTIAAPTTAAPTTAAPTTAAVTTAAPTTAAPTTAAPTTAAVTTAAPTTAAVTTTAAAAGADAGTTMTIKSFAFSPLTTKVGTAVTVTNSDTAPHTVTDVAGSFDVKVPAGGTATLTITKPGTYSIHCTIHPKMLSTITVTA